MGLLGIFRRKPPPAPVTKLMQPIDGGRTQTWQSIIRESFPGSWQRNITLELPSVSQFAPVYSCTTLIVSDIAKMRIRLVQMDRNGIWQEIENPAYSPVLRKPNHYQTRIEFIQHWVLSKLNYGNAYILKERDLSRHCHGNVRAQSAVDPHPRCRAWRRLLPSPEGRPRRSAQGPSKHSGSGYYPRQDEYAVSSARGDIADLCMRAVGGSGASDPAQLRGLLCQWRTTERYSYGAGRDRRCNRGTTQGLLGRELLAARTPARSQLWATG